MLGALPLLTPVVAVYFVIAFTFPSSISGVVLGATLPSGAAWTLTTGDLLVALGLFVLFFEILKSVRASMATVIDHAVSLLLFALCLVLFFVLPRAGTGTFFLITVMTLIDVLAGFTVTIAASRRSIDVAHDGL